MGNSPMKSKVILFGALPLSLAVYAKKVDFIVAIDVSVWLIAIIALFYVVKTPWGLYFLVRHKTEEVEEKERRGIPTSNYERDELLALANRMFIIAWVTPFVAIGGWFFIAEYFRRYNLNSMTEMIHPYLIILIGIMSGLVPVTNYYKTMKKELAVMPPSHSETQKEIAHVQRLLRQSERKIGELTQNVHQEVDKVQQHCQRFDKEIRNLKKACKAESAAKLNEINRLERKVIGLENQVELMQILAKEGNLSEQKTILEAIVPSFLRHQKSISNINIQAN